MPRHHSGKLSSDDFKQQRRWIWCCCLITPWLLFAAFSQLVYHAQDNLQSAPRRSSRSSTLIPRTVDDSDSDSEEQQNFLAAVIFNRVFEADKFNITAHECRQWVDYMLSSGVDRVYWYDTAHQDSEVQQEHFNDYIGSGRMKYHRFYSIFPRVEGSDFHYEQDNSYSHFLRNYNTSTRWVVEMDVDEYPFSTQDLSPGFLARFIRRIEKQEQGSVSQILLQCMLFMGNPIEEGWVIERYQRRKAETEGITPGFHSRQKPIFRPGLCAGVTSFDPHHFSMLQGRTIVSPATEMRMNHYWGPRLTDFGPDTPEAVASLVEDRSIRPIAEMLRGKGIRTLSPTKGKGEIPKR